MERFRQEARAQANLNHTNIAMLHAFITQAGQASRRGSASATRTGLGPSIAISSPAKVIGSRGM
jgi:hypothetical protein